MSRSLRRGRGAAAARVGRYRERESAGGWGRRWPTSIRGTEEQVREGWFFFPLLLLFSNNYRTYEYMSLWCITVPGTSIFSHSTSWNFYLFLFFIYILVYPRILVFGKMAYQSIPVSRTGIRIRVSGQHSCPLQNWQRSRGEHMPRWLGKRSILARETKR